MCMMQITMLATQKYLEKMVQFIGDSHCTAVPLGPISITGQARAFKKPIKIKSVTKKHKGIYKVDFECCRLD